MKRYYIGFLFKEDEWESLHSTDARQTDFEQAIDSALCCAKDFGSMVILSEVTV